MICSLFLDVLYLDGPLRAYGTDDGRSPFVVGSNSCLSLRGCAPDLFPGRKSTPPISDFVRKTPKKCVCLSCNTISECTSKIFVCICTSLISCVYCVDSPNLSTEFTTDPCLIICFNLSLFPSVTKGTEIKIQFRNVDFVLQSRMSDCNGTFAR